MILVDALPRMGGGGVLSNGDGIWQFANGCVDQLWRIGVDGRRRTIMGEGKSTQVFNLNKMTNLD